MEAMCERVLFSVCKNQPRFLNSLLLNGLISLENGAGLGT